MRAAAAATRTVSANLLQAPDLRLSSSSYGLDREEGDEGDESPSPTELLRQRGEHRAACVDTFINEKGVNGWSKFPNCGSETIGSAFRYLKFGHFRS